MNRLFFLSLGLYLTLTSCTKNTSNLTKAKEELQLASSVSSDALQQVYAEFTPEEKYQLWQSHFDSLHTIYANESAKVELIEILKSTLSVSMFNEDSEERAIFLNYTLPSWSNQAKSHFSDQEIFNIIMQNKLVSPQSNFEPEGEETKTDCFCHVGNTGYSCKKWKFGFPSGVEVTYGMCEAPTGCDGSRWGCGALWLESCNGAHCNW